MEGVCMQIQSVNNSLEFGKSHNRRAREAAIRQQEDAILSLNDKQVRMLATDAAAFQTNDKKHKNISAALIASLPIVYGAQSAISSRGMNGKAVAETLAQASPTSLTTKFFNTVGKNLKGPAARVAVGAASAVGLIGLFAVVDGVLMAKKAAVKNSEGARNFQRKHPGTTMLATIGTAFAAAHYIPKGISALADRISPKTVVKMQKTVSKYGQKFNNNSFVKSLASGWQQMTQSAPSSVKSVGKYAVALAPLAVVVGTLVHAFDHSAKKNKVAAQNYREFKGLQMEILNQRRINNEKAARAMAEKLSSRNI